MAIESGIGWTDATVNFVIGCERAGPGCGEMINGKLVGCYAAELARNRFGISFEPGGERRVTKNAFVAPGVWHRKRERGELITIKTGKKGEPWPVATPLWVFACSLSDFFDKRWPPGVRDRAWRVIRETPSLRWQLTTKRVGNVLKMLPADWDDGRNYPHVGIIATMVDQHEVNRDMGKLLDLKTFGVRWVGVSIEPQLGPVSLLDKQGTTEFAARPDWIITGGMSKQGTDHVVSEYDLQWALDLVNEGRMLDIPVFVKQIGDRPVFLGRPYTYRDGTPIRNDANPDRWPKEIRVQQMPRVYGDAEERYIRPTKTKTKTTKSSTPTTPPGT